MSNPTTMSPYMRRAVELLADGEWHDREPIVREIARIVTPGTAYREMEMARRLPGAPAKRVRQRTTEFLISAGQRRVALLTLNRARRIERREIDGVVQVRLIPAVTQRTKVRTDSARRELQGEGSSRRAG